MNNLFKNLFGSKENNFLGVDIGSSSIKVVQLKKKNGIVVLETYGEIALGPYAQIEVGRATSLSSAQLSDALVSLLKEANVSAIKCGASIPLRSSLVFTMEMPAVSEKQLEQMVPIEARKYIPVPISEVDLDWKIIPQEEKHISDFVEDEKKEEPESKKINILAVAIHKDAVAKQKEIIGSAKLDLNFLEIEIFSTIRAVAGQNMFNFAILDMGAGDSKLYIVEKGIIRYSHIIGRGSQDITLNISRSTGISIEEAELKKRNVGVEGGSDTANVVISNLDYIFAEINKVILNYQKKYNKNIDKLVITGGGAIIKGMENFAKTKVEVETTIADPFSKVDNPAFLDSLLKEVGPGFAVAIGLALRGLKQLED